MDSKLKYPILLVHGMGFRDYRRFCYWGRIPDILKKMGCEVFFACQDSNANIETNAEVIAKRIEEVLHRTGKEKVNIFAHSKGGLDSRYAISVLKAGDKVASLTTLSTPHHGSETVDKLMKFPKPLIKLGCFFADCWFSILGDKNPDTYSAISSFKTDSARHFNNTVLDHSGVYYQSYAFLMKKPSSDIFMCFTNAFVNKIEGQNDGLLVPDSVKWGEFKGIIRGFGNRGVSHCDEVDMRRKPLAIINGERKCDILDLYRDIVYDLQKRGF